MCDEMARSVARRDVADEKESQNHDFSDKEIVDQLTDWSILTEEIFETSNRAVEVYVSRHWVLWRLLHRVTQRYVSPFVIRLFVQQTE